MAIKTGNEIYLEALDVIEANKKSKYDDETTQQRKLFDNKKYITVDEFMNEFNKIISYEHFGLLIGGKTGRDVLIEMLKKLKILNQ